MLIFYFIWLGIGAERNNGRLKELRKSRDIAKVPPSGIKASPKEGVERCACFKKLIDQLVVVEFGYVTVIIPVFSPYC